MLRKQRIILANTQSRSSNLPSFIFLLEREHAWDSEHSALSHVLVCPFCCEVWARLWFEEDKVAYPVAQFCELHGAYDKEHYPVPGSLLAEEGYGVIDTALLAALPHELVIREFNLHMEYYK